MAQRFVLLSGSDPGCLHSAAGEAPCCLDKLPNTESEGCPITHLLRRVCAVSPLFNPLQHTSEARDYFFMQKSDAHWYIADVHRPPTVFLFILQHDSWNWNENACLVPVESLCPQSVHPYQLLCLSFLQEEKGISCGLVDLDFLKCSVGFPFMRAQTKVAYKPSAPNSYLHAV